MPGGMLIGDDAGFLNNLKQKGTHTAMKSGMIASEVVFDAIKGGATGGDDLPGFQEAFEKSWLFTELHKARNTGVWLHKFGTFFRRSCNLD